jgi:hypothetical protein
MANMMMENRRRSCRRQLVIASGALALVAAVSCAADSPGDVTVLWSANDQWVKIEPQDDAAASPNDHPAQLTSEAISNALAALRIRIVDGDTAAETQRSVFTAEELRNLAPRIASGLAKAGPRQDVTFSTIGSHPRAAGGLVKDPGVNAGRVFYDDARINVIFGELQSGYRKRSVYGQRTEDFTARREGSRTKAAEHEWMLAARPGVQLHSTPGGVRNDWVEIDTAAVASGAAAVSQAPGEVPAATKSGVDLEQRLKTLKELRDKNLISEEAYRAKMQELLSEL